MLKHAFFNVYTKFKLHFYQEIFLRFQNREASLTTVETFCMESILALPENEGKLACLGRVRDARFKRQVVPGDVVEMECVLTKQRGPIGVGTCKPTVNGEVAVTAEITFAIQAG